MLSAAHSFTTCWCNRACNALYFISEQDVQQKHECDSITPALCRRVGITPLQQLGNLILVYFN